MRTLSPDDCMDLYPYNAKVGLRSFLVAAAVPDEGSAVAAYGECMDKSTGREGDNVTWVPAIAPRARPKYRAIAAQLAADIACGRLRPGERLPSQRDLARALGVDLTTVTRAFAEARRQGLIDASVGRGSFVTDTRSAPAPAAMPVAPLVDMSMNMPPQPPEARLVERLRDGLREVLQAPDALLRLHYQDVAGALPDRVQAAAYLSRRLGRAITEDRALVVGGAQNALGALAAALFEPGDVLCTGALTYPGIRAVARQHRLRLAPISSDAEGLDPAAFEALCRQKPPRALYCVPAIDNPTTATMDIERRRAVADIATRHGAFIIEDDAYGALLPHPLPALASLAPEVTWHVATLSKALTPALRIAYVASPDLVGGLRLAAELRATSPMAPPLMAALASRWLSDGTAAAVTAAVRAENAARQAMARDILPGVAVRAHPHGPHLWLPLPPPWTRSDFAAQAGRSGLAIVPSDAFSVVEPPEAVRVALGAAPTRAVLERALRVLAALLAGGGGAASAVV